MGKWIGELVDLWLEETEEDLAESAWTDFKEASHAIYTAQQELEEAQEQCAEAKRKLFEADPLPVFRKKRRSATRRGTTTANTARSRSASRSPCRSRSPLSWTRRTSSERGRDARLSQAAAERRLGGVFRVGYPTSA